MYLITMVYCQKGGIELVLTNEKLITLIDFEVNYGKKDNTRRYILQIEMVK